MEAAQLQLYRKMLEDQLKALVDLEGVGQAATATVVLDQSSVGRLSRMDAMQGQAMAQASQRRRGLELQRIRRALERVSSGDYGFCLDCDEPIATGRLDGDPAAERCVVCAQKHERNAPDR